MHVCVSSYPRNLLHGTGKDGHSEVNGLWDKGQSFLGKRVAERERAGGEAEVIEKEEKDGAKVHRQGVIVKGEESANKCELEIEMVKQKLCVPRVCVGKETVVLLSPEPAALRLSGQVSTRKQ